jgi:hypothetical protein
MASIQNFTILVIYYKIGNLLETPVGEYFGVFFDSSRPSGLLASSGLAYRGQLFGGGLRDELRECLGS